MDRGAREHRGPWEDLDRTPRRKRSQCAYAHNNGRVHRANNNPTTTDRNLDRILRRSSVDNGNRLPKRNAVQLSRCKFYPVGA